MHLSFLASGGLPAARKRNAAGITGRGRAKIASVVICSCEFLPLGYRFLSVEDRSRTPILAPKWRKHERGNSLGSARRQCGDIAACGVSQAKRRYLLLDDGDRLDLPCFSGICPLLLPQTFLRRAGAPAASACSWSGVYRVDVDFRYAGGAHCDEPPRAASTTRLRRCSSPR